MPRRKRLDIDVNLVNADGSISETESEVQPETESEVQPETVDVQATDSSKNFDGSNFEVESVRNGFLARKAKIDKEIAEAAEALEKYAEAALEGVFDAAINRGFKTYHDATQPAIERQMAINDARIKQLRAQRKTNHQRLLADTQRKIDEMNKYMPEGMNITTIEAEAERIDEENKFNPKYVSILND